MLGRFMNKSVTHGEAALVKMNCIVNVFLGESFILVNPLTIFEQ